MWELLQPSVTQSSSFYLIFKRLNCLPRAATSLSHHTISHRANVTSSQTFRSWGKITIFIWDHPFSSFDRLLPFHCWFNLFILIFFGVFQCCLKINVNTKSLYKYNNTEQCWMRNNETNASGIVSGGGSSGSGGTMLRNEEWRGWTCFVFQWRRRCWSVATAGSEMSLGRLMVLLDNDNAARQFSHQLHLSVQWVMLPRRVPRQCEQSQLGFVMTLHRSSGCGWEEWREVVIAVALPPRATEAAHHAMNRISVKRWFSLLHSWVDILCGRMLAICQ